MSMPNKKLFSLFKQFDIDGEIEKINELKIGHIHKTYIGTWKVPQRKDFIHQEMNSKVFTDIPLLMDNTTKVLNHFSQMKKEHRYELDVPELIRTKDGASYIVDGGTFWRTFSFIDNTQTFDMCSSSTLANEAGRCFGLFHKALSVLPSDGLQESIPFFMDGGKRIDEFLKVVSADEQKRLSEVQSELEFVEKHKDLAAFTQRALDEGKVPRRIVHGDMKLNNLLFDKVTNKGRAIVDLDTCMPGTILYDFGDLARTVILNALEDERDLSKVVVREDLFDGLLTGYLSSLSEVLTDTEKQYLINAPAAVTFMLGIRFLTDHIAGDKYFRIHRKGQNLDRARCQFKATSEMLMRL